MKWGRGVVAVVAIVSVLVACKRKDETPPPNAGYGGYGGGYGPPGGGYPSGGYYPNNGYPNGGYYPPPQPAPAGATHAPPAMGLPCASDGDLHCPYARCVNGRCGGCSDASWCKQGSGCAPTPLGMTCWPGYANNQPPPPYVPPGPGPGVPPVTPPFTPPSNDPFAQARQTCVDRINAYRARVRAAPVARDPSGEACADQQSRADAQSNRAHGTFGRCGERAQNACPNYPGRSTEEILDRCLQQMFEEGPGGGHYDNMTNPKYTKAFCGFEQMSGGRVWTVQNFR